MAVITALTMTTIEAMVVKANGALLKSDL